MGLLALACIPVDFQLFREVRKTQEADILRERVRMLEEQERVQVVYRERIAADMEDIMKLRREVAEEMDEAVRRLREQEEGSAQERLSRAVDIMGSTAFRLCEHRSADAVATMKLKACEEAAVRPQFSLEIPDVYKRQALGGKRRKSVVEYALPQLFLSERLQLHMNHCQGGYPPFFGGSHLRAFRTVVVTAVDTLLFN